MSNKQELLNSLQHSQRNLTSLLKQKVVEKDSYEICDLENMMRLISMLHAAEGLIKKVQADG